MPILMGYNIVSMGNALIVKRGPEMESLRIAGLDRGCLPVWI
jgi:hypothetical protein